MKSIAYSSEIYYISAKDLKNLAKEDLPHQIKKTDAKAVILLKNDKNTLIKGYDIVQNASEDSFIKTRIAYETVPALLGFFVSLIKPLKRKLYNENKERYTVLFEELLKANLTRGERNAANAYEWKNKKWQISREEAHKRYEELYQSIKTNGYDKKSPMFVTLNRKFGVKDQILQGHHRIGICKDLNIKEVSIAFWTAPASFSFLKWFVIQRKNS